jgi:cytochrome c553
VTPARSRLALAVVALALAAGPTVAADMESAKKKVTEICQACHGMDGNSPLPENPKLAGQNPDYLAKALRDYKSGARKNPVMGSMASGLTTQEIDNLAAYFGSQPAVLQARQ